MILSTNIDSCAAKIMMLLINYCVAYVEFLTRKKQKKKTKQGAPNRVYKYQSQITATWFFRQIYDKVFSGLSARDVLYMLYCV